MRYRTLGRTGQTISEISFGCGNVGGLLIRGDHADQVRAVARAMELGVTYFDTAAAYGDGKSEETLGRVFSELRVGPEVLVGTKLRLQAGDAAAGPGRIRELFEASLDRLQREAVDILYYHGRIRADDSSGDRSLTVSQVIGPLMDAYQELRRSGKVRFLGFTGLGETPAVLEVIGRGGFDVMHCYFSAANPSAGYPVPPSFGPQDLGLMIDRAAAAGVGALAIRILAAGALAGAERHPLAGGTDGVLISGTDYAADAARAARLRPIAAELGVGLAELAMRFALSKAGLATALVGVSEVEQIELAARAADAGPLPPDVVQRIVDTVLEGE